MILGDLKVAARRLVADWRFALAAAFTLSLGIGANATVFTIVNQLSLRDLPFTDHGRVVSLGSRDARGRQMGVSFRDFEDWRSAKSLAGLTMWGSYTLNVSDPGRDPDRYVGVYVSTNVFTLIRQRPLLGRDFRPDDEAAGAPPVVILSHKVWQNRYGADPSLIGRTVKISELPVTVIGVMPANMNFPPNTDAWLPISHMPPGVRNMNRNARVYGALARLADGVQLEQARTELTAIGEGLASTYPDTNKEIRPLVISYRERMNGGEDNIILQLLMWAVGFVLLIACANVANLLLARSTARAREVGVRVALGAPRWRIVRQLLAESLLLALCGGLLGVWIGYAALRVFIAQTADAGFPYWVRFSMDTTVYAFLGAICVTTSVVFGLVPALHVSKTDVNQILKEGGRGGSGTRSRRWAGALIMTELVLTLVLMSGAGLMMRSFMAMYNRELGFNSHDMLVMSLSLASRKYPTSQSRADFYARLEDRLGAIPAVRAATVASHGPFSGWGTLPLAIDGRDASGDRDPLTVNTVAIGPHYFEALDVRPMRGRTLVAADGQAGQTNVVVNQDFVIKFLPNRDPLGARVRLGNAGQASTPNLQGAAPPATWYNIVGVTPMVSQRNMQDNNRELQPIAYVSHSVQSFLFARLLVRTTGNAAAIAPLVRAELRTVDPDVPVVDIMTMDTALSLQRQGPVIVGSMLSIFAGIALVLSAVGLYAVTAHSVAQRTSEIGIRMALGAQSTQVHWMFFRTLLLYLAVGLAIGVVGSVGVGWLLRSVLYGVGPFDAATLAGTAIVLTMVAVAACYWPARYATRISPLIALRHS